MASYKSGFCSVGLCEGIKPRNINDHALPTCTMIGVCSCKCHSMFDQMYKQTGMERIAVDNSGYVPDRGDFVMPSLTERTEERLASDETIEMVASDAPEVVPNLVVRKFNQTPTGRAARGELEQQVNTVCAAWAVDKQPATCTPAYVSEEIAREYGIKAPSVGAIGAVWDRWAAIGYATVARKPVRFVGFTDAGLELGLEALKARAKAAKRRALV